MGLLGLSAIVVLILVATTATAEPVADNIVVSQRADGSGMVDIYYDLSGGVGEITVEVLISNDGGASWTITPQPAYLSGDVGVVANGAGKHILWNGMADQPDICWPQMQVQLSITDEMPDAGDELTINLPGDVPLVLVYVPAGTFMMGRYPGEQDSDVNEDPQHSVTIAQGFYMGKYEVTQQQWLAVMGSWPGEVPSSDRGLGDTYPAYLISWDDAKNFITVLNTHITNTSQGPATVRLPSEAEWEYACRAGTTTRFYWDDDPSYTLIDDYAWYSGNNSLFGSKPVGGKLPNAFGLYDMSGNVWEWCEDDWHDSYTGAPVNGSIWVDNPRGSYRVLRGGYYLNTATACRSACRRNDPLDNRVNAFGFRVAAITQCDPDLTRPVITLLGDAVVSVVQGSTYTDAGATADDLCEGDLTASIIVGGDTVDTNTLGTYVITYNVSDSASNAAAEVTRTVYVVEELTINLPGDVPLALVYIPAGTFMMGQYPGEPDGHIYEDPQHEVTIAQGFYIGKYEITQQQWLAMMGSWPGTPPTSEQGLGDNYPAYYLSWDDAKNFLLALNVHITNTSQGSPSVRLPNEAEWEYACRAGTTTRFYFGDSLGCSAIDCSDCAAGVLPGNRSDYMWYCGNNSTNSTKPVGGKLPNAFGLYDMSGNLWEWVEDDYHSSYTGAPADGSAWVDTPRGPSRVLRGGSYYSDPVSCRSVSRYGNYPNSRDGNFRVLWVP